MATSRTSCGLGPKTNARFVARQPILTTEEKVFGYELLFRSGMDNCFTGADHETASRSTVQTSMLMGLDVLCDGRRAFVNCSREVLLKEYVTLLPSTQVVVEVLENVPADDLVISACRHLKEGGYLIALDDFTLPDDREPLVELADIIKIDIRQTSLQRAATELSEHYGRYRHLMLAEKVETREEFLAAKKAGFVYFQGYFFRKPEILTAHDIPENQANYLRMWQAASRPQLDVREIEDLIKGEASLCYRLLRYLNSPAFGFSHQIHSVRHALTLLGEREVRRWIRLVATLGAGQGKPSELVLSALVRGHFCELFSSNIRHEGDLFLLGLLSLMDAILQIPMDLILENVPVDREIRAALQGGPSSLNPFYQLMVAQESGDWQTVSGLANQLHVSETSVAEAYWNAVRWAQQVTAQE